MALMKKWFSIACITMWGAAIYSNTLRVPFVFDDTIYIQDNPVLRNPLDLFRIIGFAPSRWIGFFTFSLNNYFAPSSTLGYHLLNLAIHIASAMTCYWLTLLTLRTPCLRDEVTPGSRSVLGLLAGLIFLSHPVQTQAVTYIWQRVESLAALFYLLSLAFYATSRIRYEAKRQSPTANSSLCYVASFILACMSAMTKETAITLPVTIILYEIVFFAKTRAALRHIALRVSPFLCLLIIVPALARQSSAVTENFLYESPSRWSYMMTQTRVIATYLQLLVWPVEQNLDYDFSLSQSLLVPEVLWSLLLISSVLALGLLLYRASPLVTFGTIWFFVTLSPSSSLVPLPDLIFEHRLYLPLVGFALVLTGILVALRQHMRLLSAVMIFPLLLLSAGTYHRNSVWRNGVTLWQDTVNKSPAKARPRVNLAISYIDIGEYEKAFNQLTQAIALRPDFAPAYENLGVVNFFRGDYGDAVVALKKAASLSPEQASTYDHLAQTYLRLGNKDLAIENFTKALALDPTNVNARNNLGLTLAEKALYAQAIAQFEEVLQRDPTHREAVFNLAQTHALSGNVNLAVRYYLQVIQAEPDLLEAYHNLGILYLHYLHKPIEAKRCFEQALVLTKDPRKAVVLKEIIAQIEEANHQQMNPTQTYPAGE
jgi:tetratricopeptide (TPR) repeat protein